jgi:hypothetical protein
MTAGEQARVSARIIEWSELTPEQRLVVRRNYRAARQLDPDERRARWKTYNSLPSEQREALRSRWDSGVAGARRAGTRTGLGAEPAQPWTPRQEPAGEN